MRTFMQGQPVKFRTSGYEVADARNPNPPSTAHGIVNGEVVSGYLPVYAEREGREATTIMVALDNII